MRLFLFITFLFAGQCLQAQLAGRVSDSISTKGLPYVTMRLLRDKQLIRTAITDSSGQFSLAQPAPGVYTLQASIAGYILSGLRIEVINGQLFPPVEIRLSPATKDLQNVTVTAQRPLVTARTDGFEYDAARDVQMAGETAGDMLRKLPGVQVDHTGLPSMRGSTRIKIFIDGQPSEAYAPTPAEALRMIGADNVARVEIITQPSARYDGEGVDGVINIYTKKRLSDGSSGNINAYTGTRGGHLVPSINIRKGRWLISADAGYYGSTNKVITQRQRVDKTGGFDLDQYQATNNKGRNKTAGTTITRTIDSLTTASAGMRYSNYRDDIVTGIDYTILSGGVVQDQYQRDIDNPFRRTTLVFTFAFSKKSRDKTAELSVIGNSLTQQISNNYTLQQDAYTESNDNRSSTHEQLLQADYTKKLRRGNTLETGIKGTFRRFRNNSIFWPDQDRGEAFYFPRDIFAVYAGYAFNIGKWKARIGSRYEQTILSIKTTDTSLHIPDYRNLLPNVLLSHIKGPNTFSISYNRRLLRPYLNLLNPVINYIDSLNLSYGNPYLDPAINNNYELAYTYNKDKWFLLTSFFYYQTIRSIEAVVLLKTNGIVERTYQNVSRNDMTGLSAQVMYRGKKLSVNTNCALRNIAYISGATNIERSGWVLTTGMNLNYKWTPSFMLNGGLTLNTKRIDFQGTTSGTRYYVFSANKTFKGGKYAVNLRVDNLFMPFQTIREVTRSENVDILSDAKVIRRFFRIAFNYKFGKKEIREAQVRTVSGEN